jgi:sorbitol/mannitol transport system permease protein
MTGCVSWGNYLYVVTDPSLTESLINTLIPMGGVLPQG